MKKKYTHILCNDDSIHWNKTRKPTSRNELLIIFQSVVSGQADPDTIVLKKSWNGQLQIHLQSIGTKTTTVTMSEDSAGIKTVQADKKLAKIISLTNKKIHELGKVGILVEEAYGGPRDIEWAFYKVFKHKNIN